MIDDDEHQSAKRRQRRSEVRDATIKVKETEGGRRIQRDDRRLIDDRANRGTAKTDKKVSAGL